MCNICALALNQCIMKMMMMMTMKQKGIEGCVKGKYLKYVCKYHFETFHVSIIIFFLFLFVLHPKKKMVTVHLCFPVTVKCYQPDKKFVPITEAYHHRHL